MKLEERVRTTKVSIPFATAMIVALSPSRANAQGPPVDLPSELRGFVDPNGLVIDSLFTYNKKDSSLLDETVLSEADTVNAQGDTVRVPNFYRFVIPTDKASTPNTVEGATAGDTLYFRAKANGDIYTLIPRTGPVIHEPGQIKRVDMDVGTIVAIENPRNIPQEFKLYQNYPNPFNPNTTIRYDVNKRSHVHLTVYDINGRVVKKLVDATKTAGEYGVVWDGTNKSMNHVASGIYIYRLKTGNTVLTRKMTLFK